MRRWFARWLHGIAERLDPPIDGEWPEPDQSLEESYHHALLESMDRANALGAENDRLRADLSGLRAGCLNAGCLE